MTDRQGIEIDYCQLCRGMWLDRGELDKLIDRAAIPSQPTADARRFQSDFVDSDYRDVRGHQNQRKKSWLSDIFD
jgi:Zn-finger nucleic acid-binding protein